MKVQITTGFQYVFQINTFKSFEPKWLISGLNECMRSTFLCCLNQSSIHYENLFKRLQHQQSSFNRFFLSYFKRDSTWQQWRWKRGNKEACQSRILQRNNLHRYVERSRSSPVAASCLWTRLAHHSIQLSFWKCSSNVLKTYLKHIRSWWRCKHMALNEIKLHCNLKTAFMCLTSGIALQRSSAMKERWLHYESIT